MAKKMLNGDQAMAYGALDSGIRLAAGYPGSPSSGSMETLIGIAEDSGIYVEWSSNERVALEMGIGTSIAGHRALICSKSVGLNVMMDPLMVLNLTPLHGGLVILLGDDPGGYGSQNDQDSRALAAALEMPILEPAGPAEGYAMMREAYALSERYQIPVFMRETRSFTQQEEWVSVAEDAIEAVDVDLIREPFRFVPVPTNAVAKHRSLHERIESVRFWADRSTFNRFEGKGHHGIIAAGFAYRKLRDVLGDENPDGIGLLKLGVHFPLPIRIITEFMRNCQDILILEENEPFLESRIKAIAHEAGCPAKIFGKESDRIPREGELFRWHIQQGLEAVFPGIKRARQYREENEPRERPSKKDYCVGCRYDEVLDALEAAAKSLGQRPLLVGDPGCLVTVADRLDAKYAIGSAIGVADGLSKAGAKERCVAVFGDSAFFHTALPALCNAVHNRSNILMVILDNKATATSGFQVNPGVGRDAGGQDAPALDIERIAHACGVPHITTCDLDAPQPALDRTFKQALSQADLTMIIVRIGGRD